MQRTIRLVGVISLAGVVAISALALSVIAESLVDRQVGEFHL